MWTYMFGDISSVTLNFHGVSSDGCVLTHSLLSTPRPFSIETSARPFSEAGMNTVTSSPARQTFLSNENASIAGASGSFLSARPLYAGQSA